MADLFSGLEGFGLSGTESIQVFEVPTEAETVEEVQKTRELQEEDLLFDKTYKCPVCDSEFKSKMVRTGKAKLLSADMDLRPKYQGVDSLKYDAVMCPKCGYSALNRYFNFIVSAQARLIREQISKNFKDQESNDKIYNYDTSLVRHKMALLNTVIKKGKDSEKAYTCLKIAWLFRGKKELMMQGEYDKNEVEGLIKEENEFIKTAYEGFLTAFEKEDFPMCGMDQYTMMYMIAELARRVGDFEESKRWVAKVLIARDAQRRIKDKAMDLKDLLQAQ